MADSPSTSTVSPQTIVVITPPKSKTEVVETQRIAFSGIALAYMTYENSHKKFFTEGILIGEARVTRTKVITDSDNPVLNVSRILQINTAVECPKSSRFYNGSGQIDIARLRSFLDEMASEVVGWYKYKPNSFNNLNMTFREILIHKQLEQFFELPLEFTFPTCLVRCKRVEEKHSTLSYGGPMRFLKLLDGCFKEIPYEIINLDKNDKLNYAYNPQRRYSTTVSAIIEEVRKRMDNFRGAAAVTALVNAFQQAMMATVDELYETEIYAGELQEEVDLLVEAMQKSQRSPDK